MLNCAIAMSILIVKILAYRKPQQLLFKGRNGDLINLQASMKTLYQKFPE